MINILIYCINYFYLKKSGKDNNIEKNLINFQKHFLHFIEMKISKTDIRDELIDIIYELRYYKTLKISEKISIIDIEELDEYVEILMKFAVTKLCKMGAMKIFSMDINLNFEIIKYALNSKIIELEKIKLYFDTDDKGLIIKIYDKDILEKQGRKKINISKEMLEVKKRKKIKLFN